MRNAFAEALYVAATNDPRIVVVVADISPAGSMQMFQKEFPERFINVGVAEQAMIGMAAGLALKGLRPFCYTIATFALYRPFEFVRNDLAYQGLPVTVVGMGAGVVYSTLGGTHHAMEDVAVASAIPGMQVLAPCDPLEVAKAVEYCATQERGPVYLRIGKSGEPLLDGGDAAYSHGKLRKLRGGYATCILGYGPILGRAMKKWPQAAAFSCHTLKPLDREGIAEVLAWYDNIIVVEEHVKHLGLRVKEIAFDLGFERHIDCYSLKDEFLHCYGSHEDILTAHGLPA